LTNQPSICLKHSSSLGVIRSAVSQENLISEPRSVVTAFTRACHKKIKPNARPFAVFLNIVNFFLRWGVVSASFISSKLQKHPLSALHNCLLGILAATLHIWGPFWASQGKCFGMWSCHNLWHDRSLPCPTQQCIR